MKLAPDMKLRIPYDDGAVARWAETAFPLGPGAGSIRVGDRDFIVVSLDHEEDESTVGRIGYDPDGVLVVGLAMVAKL